MTSLLHRCLHDLRHDRNAQDALFCAACWLGFATVVVAAVVLPA